VQIPGLDGTAEFSLVHPVASLIDRSRGIPEDLSLEPRDCLSLYRAMVKHQTESHPVKASLNPSKALPKIIKKSDILNWETDLKLVLRAWMTDPLSPFPAVLKEVSKSLKLKSRCLADQVDTDADQVLSVLEAEDELQTTLPMLTALNDRDALPAIIFNFDRGKCEVIAQTVSNQLRVAENAYKDSTVWQRKLKEWEEWKKAKEKARQLRKKVLASQEKAKKKRNGDDDEERGSKLDRMMTEADDSSHPMASFAPNAPVQGYHFMDERKLSMSELEDYCAELRKRGVSEWLLRSLLRGIGVHHAGMNRKYRQVVEILFRKGFLRVVIATGTLALGKWTLE
jgi:superfamily II RNA helicase